MKLFYAVNILQTVKTKEFAKVNKFEYTILYAILKNYMIT